ncbi:hypothetical protein L916_02968 [Phytophthora nicotianae]|uniref:Uncharacterized protein n=1 Tax=Phytophthora nicotianae TaxID=4792 RepID=W2JLH4_PHYNI|nr:hypothetical protein L916_02968 [Phytophthora nicotianae]
MPLSLFVLPTRHFCTAHHLNQLLETPIRYRCTNESLMYPGHPAMTYRSTFLDHHHSSDPELDDLFEVHSVTYLCTQYMIRQTLHSSIDNVEKQQTTSFVKEPIRMQD